MNSQKSDPHGDAENEAKPVAKPRYDETQAVHGDSSIGSERGSRSRPEEWVGRRLGKYEITGVLGVGGMGVVLKAHDTSIERNVAIKVLPGEMSLDQDALGRFLSEAKSAGKLNHPNTVTIYEIAQDGPTYYLAMEIVSGGSAEVHLAAQGPYSISDATRMTIEACSGLSAAHTEGLVHRDVKPSNLLLTENGTVKVSDFGLAKRTETQTLQMTKAGQIIGTPFYMSPEQCESREVDQRSDVYSLGATFYSLLTAKSPYADSGSVVQVMFAHCNADPPDPRDIRSDIPIACAEIVKRAMATRPDERYQTVEEMRADLETVLGAISGTGISLPSQSGTNLPQPSATKSKVDKGANIGLAAAAVATVLIVAALAAYLVFGSDSRNGASADNANTKNNKSDGPVPAAPPTGEPIKIGILHSQTGTMKDSEAPVLDAALLAVSELNRDGGIMGRPVEAIVADGRSDSTVFASEAKRLINEEKVSTVFGCWTSASRKTVVPIFEEFDHLLVYPLQYEGVEESPNVVYTGAAPNQQIIPAVKWAYAFDNRRRFFLVGSDYVFPRVAHEIIKDQLEELGAELVGEEFLPLGSSEVGSVIEKIRETQPDVILNSINGDTNTAFFAELRKAGITPSTTPTISFSIGEAELQHLDVTAMSGDYAAWNYFQSVDSPENQAFVSSFREKYGPQRVVTDPMESAYFGVKLWAKAVEAAGTTETADIRRAMRNQRMRAPGGEVRIDPATQHTFKTPRIGRLLPEGQFEIVWTAAKPEPPIPYPASRTTEQWRAFLHDLYTGWGNRWAAPAQE